MAEPIVELLAENVQPRPRRLPWHGGPTPPGAVRNVGAADAARRPRPRAHSIWELALHIAYWNHVVRRRITGDATDRFPRSPSNWPRQPERPTAEAWAADRALLRDQHARLAEAIRTIPASCLGDRPAGARKWTFGELIVGIAQHDAYHTGQIQMLKRLMRTALICLFVLTNACATSFSSMLTDRMPVGAPPRFVPADSSLLIQPADTIAGRACRSPMSDPTDGTRLTMVRSGAAEADYEVPPGRYGVGADELLRLDCNTGRAAGIARR